MNDQILKACLEIMVNTKPRLLDLVFKEACLAILPRVRGVLSDEEFKHIVVYAAEQMKERTTPEVQLEFCRS